MLRVAEPAGELDRLVGEREPALGIARVVELEREPGEQPRAQRESSASPSAASASWSSAGDVLLDAAELRPAAGVAERGAAEQPGVAERPGDRGGRRERGLGVAAPGALLRRAEREQQLAVQPVLAGARELAGAQRGAVVAGRLLPREQPVGAAPGGEREVDRALGPVDRRGEREVVGELAEVRVELGAAARDQRLPDAAVQARAAQRRRGRRRASRASARARTRSGPTRSGSSRRTRGRDRLLQRVNERVAVQRPGLARARRSRTRARSPRRSRASRSAGSPSRASRRPVTSRTPGGDAGVVQRDGAAEPALASARWRTTSSMKNGLPSVSSCSSSTNAGVAGGAAERGDERRRSRPRRGRRARSARASPRAAGRRAAPRAPRSPSSRARGGQEQRALRRGRADEMAEQLERRQVGPVEVVEHDEQRRVAGDLGQQRGDRVEQAQPLGAGLAARAAASPRPRRRAAQLGQDEPELGGARAEPLGERRRARRRRPSRAASRTTGWYGRGRLLVEAAEEHDGAVVVR